MTNWLEELERLDKEASKNFVADWSLKPEEIQLANHLRNRSKEIAALVRVVQDLPTEPGWDSGSLHGKILEAKEALNNLLREGE